MYHLSSRRGSQQSPWLHNSSGAITWPRNKWFRIQRMQHYWQWKHVSRKTLEGSRQGLVLQHIDVANCGSSRMGRLVQQWPRVRFMIFTLSFTSIVRHYTPSFHKHCFKKTRTGLAGLNACGWSGKYHSWEWTGDNGQKLAEPIKLTFLTF